MVSVVATSLAVLLVVWYGGALAIALAQESAVGWRKMQRVVRMAMFIASIMVAGSVQQFLALAAYVVCGRRVGEKFANRMQSAFYRHASPLFWGPYVIENTELLPAGSEGCLYIANHTTTVDFSVVYFLPNKPHVAAVAKGSIKVLPGLGSMIGLIGGIYVSRGSKGTLASLVDLGTDRLKRGISIGMFPQGTRTVSTLDKPFRDFKKGAFVLADKTQAKIVPMTIIYPSDFMASRPSLPGVKVIVHPPITPKGDGDVDGLLKKVEAIVNAPLVAHLRGEAESRAKKTQ